MLNLGTHVHLHLCPCVCLGPCGAVTLPTPFAEFYSDVGAKTLAVQTIGSPVSGNPDALGGGYYTEGGPVTAYDHAVRIFSYKTVSGTRIYSATYLELATQTNGYNNLSRIQWIWSSVAGAHGYRVLKSTDYPGYGMAFDHYADMVASGGSGDVIFTDDQPADGLGGTTVWTAGSTVTPTSYELEQAAANGDAVSKLEDQSGNARHLLQATAANRPSVDAAGAQNSHAPLAFAATLQELVTETFAAIGPAFTAFVVVDLTSGLGPYRDYLKLGANVGFYRDGDEYLRFEDGTNCGTSADTSGRRILILTRSASGVATIHRETLLRGSGTIGTNTFNFINVGAALGSNPFFFYGLLIYDSALSDDQRALALAPLRTRFAL